MTHPRFTLALAVAAAALLVACEKTTTVTTTPTGTTTTTTTTLAIPADAASSAKAATASALDTASTAVDKAASAVEKVGGDALVTGKVKAALIADPDVKALKIDVDTRDAAVTLSGSADSAAHSARATSVAKGVDGVRSVDNRLVVAP